MLTPLLPSERRTEPRVQAAYQIAFECFLHGAKVSEGIAHSVNLSENGALIEMAQGLDLDARLILWITAPLYTLLAQGEVTHSRRAPNGWFHIGVKLTDVIEGGQEYLRDVTAHRVSDGEA